MYYILVLFYILRPVFWSNIYPTCSGNLQSPIPLFSTNATVDSTLSKFPIGLFTSSTLTGATVKNTGKSISLEATGGYIISGAEYQLPGSYQFVNLHFHWGGNGSTGSEHTMNGVSYFAEMHMVHKNTKYATIAEAAVQPDGFVVFGFFVDDTSLVINPTAQGILGLVQHNITYLNDEVTVTPVPNYNFVPPEVIGDYFRYKGSLTTPPCYESVLWYVFQSPVRLTPAQANIIRYGNNLFSSLPGDPLVPLINNFRPLQDPGNRNISRTLSFSGSESFQPAYHVIVVGILLVASLF